jgi:hypothetical protein
MELVFALLARSATAAEGELFIHGGGLRVVSVPVVPAIVPLALAARFAAAAEEIGTAHVVTLTIYDRGQPEPVVAPVPIEFELTAPPGEPVDPDLGISIVLVIAIGGLRINAEADYRFELSLDGAVIEDIPLKVRIGGHRVISQEGWAVTDAPGPDV